MSAARRRMMIALDGKERSALIELAERERRDPRQQAAVIIRCELIRRGLLKAEQRRLQEAA
jgi:hypothetical protein